VAGRRKDQQGQDEGSVAEKFFLVQQPGNECVRVEIVEGDQEPVVDEKVGREVMLLEISDVYFCGVGIEQEWKQQEAKPCCDMNDDLYGKFLQVGSSLS